MSLRVSAYRANLWSFPALYSMTAVVAVPYHFRISFEYDTLLDVGKKLPVSILELLLDGSNALKEESDVVEALFSGFLCHSGIHVNPFVVLACSRIGQICHGILDVSVVEQLEPDLGMLFLIVGGFFKKVGDLYIAFLLCLAGIVSLLVSSL